MLPWVIADLKSSEGSKKFLKRTTVKFFDQFLKERFLMKIEALPVDVFDVFEKGFALILKTISN